MAHHLLKCFLDASPRLSKHVQAYLVPVKPNHHGWKIFLFFPWKLVLQIIPWLELVWVVSVICNQTVWLTPGVSKDTVGSHLRSLQTPTPLPDFALSSLPCSLSMRCTQKTGMDPHQHVFQLVSAQHVSSVCLLATSQHLPKVGDSAWTPGPSHSPWLKSIIVQLSPLIFCVISFLLFTDPFPSTNKCTQIPLILKTFSVQLTSLSRNELISHLPFIEEHLRSDGYTCSPLPFSYSP